MGEVEEVIGTLGHPYTPFEGESLANTLIKFSRMVGQVLSTVTKGTWWSYHDPAAFLPNIWIRR